MIREEKSKLRAELKIRRAQIKNENPDLDREIFEKLKSDELFQNAKCIFCYVSYGSEPDTEKILEEILSLGKTLCVPKCIDNSGEMIATEIKSLEELVSGMYGIKEASVPCPFDKEKIDLAIVPGLSFDKMGYRLGYGKGYYDRFLKNTNIKTIGICYRELLSDSLPKEENDVKIDKVITN